MFYCTDLLKTQAVVDYPARTAESRQLLFSRWWQGPRDALDLGGIIQYLQGV